jgi:predicted alpha/beta-hydrolase family hydrolase
VSDDRERILTELRALSFVIPSGGKVSAILQQPTNAVGLLVLGHGSGSNMHVPLMEGLCEALSELRVATLRFEYPYSDKPDFVPFTDMPMDPDDVLISTIQTALDLAIAETSEIPIFVGGHSVSGFMATVADAKGGLPANGIVSLAFPRKGDRARSEHLDETTLPLLIVQGTQDPLGTAAEISEMANYLGERATVQWIDDASHGFRVNGRVFSDVINEIAVHIRDYVAANGTL